jgi:hypothetical protein
MTQIDSFFDDEIRSIVLHSRAAATAAARELRADVLAQIRRNFNNPSIAFMRGLKVHNFDDGSYVRLSPILSVHAEPTQLQGNPNLWILLPQGVKLGFNRNPNWDTLKRRYGTKLSFVSVADGHVLLFKDRGVVTPIYKIQSTVATKQRIEFFEKGEEIAKKYERT